jgi:hypothetical protein
VIVLRLVELPLRVAELEVAVLDVVERGALRGRRLLRDVRDHPPRRDVDVAGVGVQLVPQQREQARLAAAVRADQADLVARRDRERDAVEQQLVAAAERDVGDAQHA